jgi:hypothetical protein
MFGFWFPKSQCKPNIKMRFFCGAVTDMKVVGKALKYYASHSGEIIRSAGCKSLPAPLRNYEKEDYYIFTVGVFYHCHAFHFVFPQVDDGGILRI